MRQDHPAIGEFSQAFGKHARDKFVGQTMKTVALDALVKILKGQSEHSRNAGLGLMEGRVETCDLRDVGPQLLYRPDCGEVKRLV